MPYLQSPHSGNHRNENVFTVSFEKVEERDAPPPYQYLPKWLTQVDLPVASTREMTEVLKTNQVYASILSAFDGKKSLQDIAKLTAKKYSADPDQTLATIQTFLAEVFDRHGTTFA